MFGFIKDMLGQSNQPQTTNNQETNVQNTEQPQPQQQGPQQTQQQEPQQPQHQEPQQPDTNDKPKAKIYNIIIVDESGSMRTLRDVTLSGVNETISMLQCAQNELGDTQQHYLTLVTFDARCNIPPVRELISAQPIATVTEFTNYTPGGCTPLYDAMGISLTKLYDTIKDDEDATGSVTILTDGLENASHTWTADKLRKLIDKLKELGWSFSYMGSAHNVKDVADLLSIDNAVEFSHDRLGAQSTWHRERASKMAYLRHMSNFYAADECRIQSCEEKRRSKRHMADNYYANRITPTTIDNLGPNDVIVKFGDKSGLDGNIYTIPVNNIEEGIKAFINYTNMISKRYLITPETIEQARLHLGERYSDFIKSCIGQESICLPQDVWAAFGLNMQL